MTTKTLLLWDGIDSSKEAGARLRLTSITEHWVDWVIDQPEAGPGSPWTEEMSGYIKWDGCLEYSGGIHICGPRDVTVVARLLATVYRNAADMFGHCIYGDDPYAAEPYEVVG